MSEHEKVINN